MKWKVVWLSVMVSGLFVALCAAQSIAEFDMEYADQRAAENAGWIFNRPWQLIASGEFTAEPQEVRNFPSGTKAMYFGEVRNGRGTYDFPGGVWADLISPWIDIPPDCEYIKVSFSYCREVEYYTKDAYDETVCYLIFLIEEDGQTFESRWDIWKKDSRDPSQKVWQTFESEGIEVPENAKQVCVHFYFNTKDGYANNYLGWLVDDLKLESTIKPLTIETESLPQGQVNEPYWGCISATGGYEGSDYEWQIVSGRLPSRLALVPQPWHSGPGYGWACIDGVPEESGNFTFTVEVRSGRDLVATKEFTLVIRPEATAAYWSDDFETELAWRKTGLWHRTGWVNVPYPPGITMNGWAAYYGKDDFDSPNYNEGKRTLGYLESPAIPLDRALAGYGIKLAFKSWRWVEEYQGDFDKTWVEVKLNNGEWKKIWTKSSRDPSEKTWIWVETDTGLTVPEDGGSLYIRFGFDSVDSYANNYVGWLIDEVTVTLVPAELTINVDCPLPDGYVGEEYEVELKASGGVRGYTWEAEGLPAGLEVRQKPDGKWVIAGVPRVSTGRGPAAVTLRVFDGERNMKEKACQLTIHAQTLLFKETFEVAGTWTNWAASGLWKRTNSVPNVNMEDHGYVAYYGLLPKGHYDTGNRTQGALTSPEIALNGVSRVRVSFDYWREVESYAQPYDRTYVQVRFKVGGTWQSWTTYWSKDSTVPSEKAWKPAEFVVAAPSGATHMQIQFVFDSVDKYYNTFRGWLVDNVKVVEDTSTGPASLALSLPSAPPREISFFNVPNPVRDVHTTTFVVRGVEAERIRVEVYDLAGKLVWKGEALGNELTWHTEDLTGLPLANGVYLYKVYVKVGEAWIVSDVRKLVILR